MSRAANRFLSREETRLARGAHVDTRPGIARGRKAVHCRSLPERVRENEFRDADPAETFCRLENHHDRRRHCLDAFWPGWPALRGQSRERLLRRGAWDELQIEPER